MNTSILSISLIHETKSCCYVQKIIRERGGPDLVIHREVELYLTICQTYGPSQNRMTTSQCGEAVPRVSGMTKGQYFLMRIGQESRLKPNDHGCACALVCLRLWARV
jgi:hypothetical protein